MDYGWMDWAKNGQYAGSEGQSKRLEGIEIKVVRRGEAAPGSTTRPYAGPAVGVEYQVNVCNHGWTSPVRNGALAGSIGQGRGIQELRVSALHNTSSAGAVNVTATKIFEANADDQRIASIQLSLSGDARGVYDIYYRVHVQQLGWLDWARNGESAGSVGYNYQIEGIEIVIVPKDGSAPGSTARPFVTDKGR